MPVYIAINGKAPEEVVEWADDGQTAICASGNRIGVMGHDVTIFEADHLEEPAPPLPSPDNPVPVSEAFVAAPQWEAQQDAAQTEPADSAETDAGAGDTKGSAKDA